MAAMRNLASGTVDLMEAALDTLRDLPGDLGTLFAQLIDNGQDWIESGVSENAVKRAVIRCLVKATASGEQQSKQVASLLTQGDRSKESVWWVDAH